MKDIEYQVLICLCKEMSESMFELSIICFQGIHSFSWYCIDGIGSKVDYGNSGTLSSRFSPKFSDGTTEKKQVISHLKQKGQRGKEKQGEQQQNPDRKKMGISNAMQNILLSFQNPFSLEMAVIIIMNNTLSLISQMNLHYALLNESSHCKLLENFHHLDLTKLICGISCFDCFSIHCSLHGFSGNSKRVCLKFKLWG